MPTRHFAAPAYAIAVLAIALPLTDMLSGALPLRASEVSWRLTVVDLLSRTLLSPLIGLLIALGVALVEKHHRVLRAIAIVCGVVTIGIVPLLALFALDTLQMRTEVAVEAVGSFDVPVVATFVKYGITFVMLAIVTLSSWRASNEAAFVSYGRIGLHGSLPSARVR